MNRSIKIGYRWHKEEKEDKLNHPRDSAKHNYKANFNINPLFVNIH
jgi:hypothetical protein